MSTTVNTNMLRDVLAQYTVSQGEFVERLATKPKKGFAYIRLVAARSANWRKTP